MLEKIVAQIKKYDQVRNKEITLAMVIELKQNLQSDSVKDELNIEWQQDIQHLQVVREQALRTTDIIETQKELADTHLQILRKMCKRAEVILGEPGFRYAIMCFGPLSRGDAGISLALQCHVLIEKKSPAHYAYIDDLFTLLQCQLLGVDNTVIDLVIRPDVQDASQIKATGIVTIESGIQAIEDNCAQAIDHADAKCMYGDERLLQMYRQALNQALLTAEKKIKETLLQTGQLFERAPWQNEISSVKDINLVNACLLPLCTAITQLRLYYRVTDVSVHPLTLIDAFIKRGHWSEEFGNACKSELTYLYQLELQQTVAQNIDQSKQNQGMGWQRRLVSIIEKMLRPMGKMMLWLGEATAQAELFNLIKKSRQENKNHEAQKENKNHEAQTMIGMSLDFLRSSRAEELKSFPRQMLVDLVDDFNIQAKDWKLGEAVLMNNYRLLVLLVETISDLQPKDIPLLILQMEVKLQAGLYFTDLVLKLSKNSAERLMTADFLNIYFGITNLVEVRSWLEDNSEQNKSKLTKIEIEQNIDRAMQNLYLMIARQWQQNVPELTTHWKNYRESLRQLRAELKVKTAKGLAIEDLHAATADGLSLREQRMLQQCCSYLGKSSGIMCFVKFGSGSKRKDPTSSSDTECAVVYQKDSNKIQQQLQEEYIHDLLWVWQFEMVLLGESNKMHAGVHLDLPPRIKLTKDLEKTREKFAVVTVDGYIDWLKKAFYEDYTRLIPAFLFGNEQLYNQLLQQLAPYPDLPMQKEFLSVVRLAFSSASWNQPNFVAPAFVNIKVDYLRPLILGITQLIYYYEIKNISSHHPLQLLQLLIDRGYLAKDYGETYKEALARFYKLRNEHHLSYGVKSEDRKEMVIWQVQFQKIIDEVLKPFQVLLKAMGDGLAKDDLVTLHPWNFPDSRGIRLSVIMEEKKWLKLVKDELITDQPNRSLPLIKITLADETKGYLPEEVIRYLQKMNWIDESGQFKLEAKKTSEKEGTHLVHHVKTKQASFFFKVFPLIYSEEYATGRGTRLLAGRRGNYSGTPMTEVVTFEVNGVTYPVTISQPIDGEDLEKKFRNNEARHLNLEPRGFGERVITEIFSKPGDNQPQNDKVVTVFNAYTQQKEVRLICVDNEVNGGPSVIQYNDEVKVASISNAFCAGAMTTRFNQSLAYELKHIDPYLLLCQWLDDCEKKEQQIKKLFTPKQIKEFFKESATNLVQKKLGMKTNVPESSLLVMPLREGRIEENFLSLTRLLVLIKNPQLTYLELLRTLDPYIGSFYGRLFSKYKTVEERFNNGPALLYGQTREAADPTAERSSHDQGSAHQVKITVLQSLRTAQGKAVKVEELLKKSSIEKARLKLQKVSDQYRNIYRITQAILSGKADALEDIAQLHSDDLKERIINQLDFSRTNINITKLLKLMETIRFRRLRIINCDQLTDAILKRILKSSPDLQELTLRNCRNVGKIVDKKDLFDMLSHYGQTLVSVHLDNLPSLVQREVMADAPSFAMLRELSIKNCPNLNKIILNADHLKILQLANLNLAMSYQLQVPKLTILDLSAWQNLRDNDLKAMTGNIKCEHLQQVKVASDCAINSQQMSLLKKSPLFLTRKIYNLTADEIEFLFDILDNKDNEKELTGGSQKESLIALAENKSLREVRIVTNELDEEFIQWLCRIFQLNKTISWLSLSNCTQNKSHIIKIASLAPAFEYSVTLQSLYLNGINIGDDGVVVIADALHSNCALLKLNIGSCKIGVRGALALATVLPVNTRLKSINLSLNEVTKEGAYALAQSFLQNGTLSSINVYSYNSYHGIGFEGANIYAQLLMRSTSLTDLNLGGCNVGADGVAVIARALERNRAVLIFDFKNATGELEELPEPIFEPFAAVVGNNSVLKVLDLSDNGYNLREDAIKIANALRDNATLSCLRLSSNYKMSRAIPHFALALELQRTLLEFDISHTGMDMEGCKAIAKMMSKNATLTNISLRGCGKIESKSSGENNTFGVEGILLLLKSLSKNKSLTTFNYFDGGNFNELVLEQIAEVLTKNKTLVYVPMISPANEQLVSGYRRPNNDLAAALKRSIFARNYNQVQEYLAQGASLFAIDVDDSEHRTVLQQVAISGNLSVLCMLLEILRMRNLNIKAAILLCASYYNKTAIEYARIYRHKKIVAILEKCLASETEIPNLTQIFAEVLQKRNDINMNSSQSASKPVSPAKQKMLAALNRHKSEKTQEDQSPQDAYVPFVQSQDVHALMHQGADEYDTDESSAPQATEHRELVPLTPYLPVAVELDRDDPFAIDKQNSNDSTHELSPFPAQTGEELKKMPEPKYIFSAPLSPSPPIRSPEQNNAELQGSAKLSNSGKGSWAAVTPRSAATKNQPHFGVAQPIERGNSSPSLVAASPSPSWSPSVPSRSSPRPTTPLVGVESATFFGSRGSAGASRSSSSSSPSTPPLLLPAPASPVLKPSVPKTPLPATPPPKLTGTAAPAKPSATPVFGKPVAVSSSVSSTELPDSPAVLSSSQPTQLLRK